MTSHDIPACVVHRLAGLLPDLIGSGKRVCLYPAGALSRAIIDSGMLRGVALVGVADRAPERHGVSFCGVPVLPRAALDRDRADIVLICSTSYHLDMLVDLAPDCARHGIALVDLSEHMPPDRSVIELKLAAVHGLLCQAEHDRVLSAPERQDPRRLERHGFKAYSQHDEDGMLAEILRRLGADVPRRFVEFGVGDGRENNTLLLLKLGWRGLWIEGGADNARAIRRDFGAYLGDGSLRLTEAFIDRDNINDLIGASVEGEIGVLSIDIDGNDLYVWQAIEVVTPQVVVIEYNAKFPPPIKWSIAYDPAHCWRGDDYMGASLAAIEAAGRAKGYRLVGCNVNGTNAFFVRADRLGDKFLVTDDPADHYHPPRYYLTEAYKSMAGHPFSARRGEVLD